MFEEKSGIWLQMDQNVTKELGLKLMEEEELDPNVIDAVNDKNSVDDMLNKLPVEETSQWEEEVVMKMCTVMVEALANLKVVYCSILLIVVLLFIVLSLVRKIGRLQLYVIHVAGAEDPADICSVQNTCG